MNQPKVLVLFFLLFAIPLVSACSNDEPVSFDSANETDEEDTDDTDDVDETEDSDNDVDSSDNDIDEGDDPETGTAVDPLFMEISLGTPTGTTANIHEDGEDWGSGCRISVDDDPTDIRCIVEGIELGLYSFNGTFKLNYNIPEGLCKFTRVTPYAFYQRLAGTGPTSFTVTTTDDVPVLSAVVNANADITVQLDADGTPICTTNYVNLDTPVNCCEGEYTVTARVIDTAAPSDTTTVQYSEWGGGIANCLVGPAMASQELSTSGYPRPTLINMEGIGLNRDYEIDPPISQEHSTNLYIANYFDISASFDADGEFIWATAPTAIEGEEVRGYPFYQFDCLDEADDFIHRIRVLIRSWSSEAQYEIGETGSYSAGSGGDGEAYFLQQPLLDEYGWFTSDYFDFMNNYPAGAI